MSRARLGYIAVVSQLGLSTKTASVFDSLSGLFGREERNAYKSDTATNLGALGAAGAARDAMGTGGNAIAMPVFKELDSFADIKAPFTDATKNLNYVIDYNDNNRKAFSGMNRKVLHDEDTIGPHFVADFIDNGNYVATGGSPHRPTGVVDEVFRSPNEPRRMAPAALAHEMGHGYNAHKAGRKALQLGAGLGKALSPAGTLASMGAAAFGDEDVAAYAPLMALAPQLPTLAEEAYANGRGYQLFKQMATAHPNSKEFTLGKYLSTNGRGYGSYVAQALAAVAPSVAMKAVYDYQNK